MDVNKEDVVESLRLPLPDASLGLPTLPSAKVESALSPDKMAAMIKVQNKLKALLEDKQRTNQKG